MRWAWTLGDFELAGEWVLRCEDGGGKIRCGAVCGSVGLGDKFIVIDSFFSKEEKYIGCLSLRLHECERSSNPESISNEMVCSIPRKWKKVLMVEVPNSLKRPLIIYVLISIKPYS